MAFQRPRAARPEGLAYCTTQLHRAWSADGCSALSQRHWATSRSFRRFPAAVGDLEVELVLGQEEDFLLPFSQVPSLALELARLTRNLKVEEEIFELLTQQYEQAKIQEKRDTPTVQVLDEAIPPTYRSKPRRTVLVGLAGLLSLFVGVFLAFGLEYMEKVSSSEDSQKISRISSLLREDYLRLRGKLTHKSKEG